MKGWLLVSLSTLLLFDLSCGSSGSISFEDVAGITPGDGAGTALSGTFAAVVKAIAGGSCTGLPAEDTPEIGSSVPFDTDFTQADGSLEVKTVESATLRGAINFDNTFEVGGSSFLDVGDQKENVQRLFLLTGKYDNADSLEGDLQERFIGRVNDAPIDCMYVFSVTANRK